MPRWVGQLDMRRASSRRLVVLALLFTLLNAAKPLVYDDSAYYYYAKQITRDPLRPYAFEMFWYEAPEPANSILAPPVLPYWWSIALALFGERPFLWKLWLFPFSLLFVWALQALLARFARGVEAPVLWMTVFSPTFLPNLNLMLDVPALALGLSALVWFFRATAKNSPALAVLAGVVTGLAMETKYTAFLVPAVMLLYAVLFGRLRLGVVAACAALTVFVSWEAFIAGYHGESHFLCNLGRQAGDSINKLDLAIALITLIGGMCPPVLLLALTALGVRRGLVALTALLVAVAFALVACLELPTFDKPLFTGFSGRGQGSTPRMEFVVFGILGVATFRAGTAVIVRLLSGAKESASKAPPNLPPVRLLHTVHARMDRFLVGWLGLEMLGYFALSPFPATRRVLGLVVVGTLLISRLAARTCQTRERRSVLAERGACRHRLGAGRLRGGPARGQRGPTDRQNGRRLHPGAAPDASVWYVGHGGIQYYAEREGMRPAAADASILERGDWLVVPDGDVDQQGIRLEVGSFEFVTQLAISDWIPLHTRRRYYMGQSPVAHFEGPRARAEIYYVTRPFLVRSGHE